MKDDYLVNGMPSEIERIMNIRRTNNISLMDARIILKNETDYLVI